jgi:hypothetical protein
MSNVFKYLTSLLFLAIVVQVGFAGYGAFNAIDKADSDKQITKKTIENGFDPHGVLGTVVIALMLVLLIVALLARYKIRIAAVLLVLGLVQWGLAAGGTSAAWVGFFHGINALAIAGIAGSLAGNEWREARVASPA